jgi:phosphatidylserine synthase 1
VAFLQEYGVNCSDITWEKVWNVMDVFAVAHFLGWLFKAILVRHYGILWAISIMWEFTEVCSKIDTWVLATLDYYKCA